MVDNTNPTNQFHPYQAPDAIPVKDNVTMGGLQGMLGKLGLDTSKLGYSLKNVSSNESLNKARGFARSNGALVLGGLAVAAIGAGLLRKR